jgi:hypothetical protein
MKHQIGPSKFPTLERQAINRVREQFPQLKFFSSATVGSLQLRMDCPP